VPTITQGRQFIEYQYENITLLCGDFFKLRPNNLANCLFIYDRASLIALPPAMRKQYVKKLEELMPNEKSRLLITIEYPQHEMTGPPHSVPFKEIHQHFNERFDITTLESKNILEESQRFKNKGVSKMTEHVYLLNKK
jgi:thiopurine S-methyltransferase